MKNGKIETLDELYEWAVETFLEMPYQYGGEGPPGHWGIDCSGLVQRILARVGLDPKGDQTAHALWEHFRKNGVRGIQRRGALAFFGTDARISHVGWLVDRVCMLNASGGGPGTTTLKAAQAACARVKIQRLSYFKVPPLHSIYMPDYGSVGIV